MDYAQGLVGQAAVAIHNMRLLEAEAAARQQAERANELRLRFLGMISHELRTPLTSIKGFATTLLATDLTWDQQNQHEFLSIIDNEADKLADMIGQLLDLSRIESGSLRIEPKKQLLKAVMDAAQPDLILAAQDHAHHDRRAGRFASGEHRLRAHYAGAGEPGEQCGQILARLRTHPRHRAAGGRLGACAGHRPGTGNCPR